MRKYKVYFKKPDEIRVIGDSDDVSGARQIIRDFLKAHNYHSHYTRLWNADTEMGKVTMLDVGSHTEFFFIAPPIKLDE